MTYFSVEINIFFILFLFTVPALIYFGISFSATSAVDIRDITSHLRKPCVTLHVFLICGLHLHIRRTIYSNDTLLQLSGYYSYLLFGYDVLTPTDLVT